MLCCVPHECGYTYHYLSLFLSLQVQALLENGTAVADPTDPTSAVCAYLASLFHLGLFVDTAFARVPFFQACCPDPLACKYTPLTYMPLPSYIPVRVWASL